MQGAEPQGRRASSWQHLLYVPYACASVTTWLCWVAGYVEASTVLIQHALCVAILLLFVWAHHRHALRWDQQRVAQAHLLSMLLPFVVISSPMQHPAGRAAMLMTTLNVLAYGTLSLNTRRYLEVSGVFVVFYIALLGWLNYRMPEQLSLRHEGLLAFAFFIAALMLSLLGGQINRMRHHLRQRTQDLDDAVERLQALASHDELTGLPNRRALLQRLQALQQRLSSGGAGYALALIDVDHFKQVNDNHGHDAGDAALRAIAQLASRTVQPGELFGRWGGEEFLLIVDAADEPQATQRAQALRIAVEGLPVDDIGLAKPLTISVGVAPASADQPADATLAAADAMLYEAKRAGRNCVIAAQAVLAPARSEAPSRAVAV